MSEFIQHLCWLDMFRTSPVHHQERFVQAVFAYYHIQNLQIQLVQNAPDDGTVRSETC